MINKDIKLLALFLLSGMLALAVWAERDFGEPGGPGDGGVSFFNAEENITMDLDRTTMDDFYLDNSQNGEVNNTPGIDIWNDGKELKEDGPSTNNVVTAIVFDYRGFDTLGEATVLFAAVSGVLVALRIAVAKTDDKKKGGGK